MAIKQEQIQASRFASAAAMARALEAARKRIRLGDWVTVKTKPEPGSHNGRALSGQVIYKNQHYFTLQAKHYREAFSFINVVLGNVEII